MFIVFFETILLETLRCAYEWIFNLGKNAKKPYLVLRRHPLRSGDFPLPSDQGYTR